MVFVRVLVVQVVFNLFIRMYTELISKNKRQEMTRIAAKACTIATRYSCVRHQSELKPG